MPFRYPLNKERAFFPMNLRPLVFLGSGVSRPTFGECGLVDGLTEALFQDRWVLTTAETWEPDRGHNAAYRQPPVQEFLKRLSGHVEDYYMESRGSRPNYEDLYGLAHQVSDEDGWRDNAAVAPFRLEVRRLCVDLLPPRRSFADKPLENLARRSLDFIQKVIATQLITPERIEGLELLRALVQNRGSQPLTICTLNHDLLVEKFLDGDRIVDGFSPNPIHEVRYFDRHEFAITDCDVKLLKLHGSINWRVLPNDDVGIFTPADNRKDRNGEPIDVRQDQPKFLTGAVNRLLDYQTGIFLAQLTEFDRALEEHDLIVMSGYGWGDQGISRRLKVWASKQDRRIVLLHEEPENLQAARPLQHSFDRLVKDRRLILIRKWMKDVGIDEIQAALSGLS